MSHTYSSLPVSSKYPKDLHRTSPTNIPPSKASIATSYATATALPHALTENIPPSASTASIGTYRDTSLDTSSQAHILPHPAPRAKNKSRIGIPKSRTLNVFSNLTSSFSRTSLGSFAHSDSRHTSASSGCSVHDTMSARSRPGSGGSSLASDPSQARARTNPVPNNPRQIYTAQSSAYWTGRFMALQDRFRSELLMPENMNTLVTAHAERSMVGASQPPFGSGSLATSATTSCLSNHNITPRTARRVVTNAVATPRGSSISPRKPQLPQTQPRQVNPVTPMLGKDKNKHTISGSTIFSNATFSNHGSSEAAALLTDEDNRTRRVFLHLEALCTTSEARRSLRTWQQSYARRVGKPILLPQGGTMNDRDKCDNHDHGQWRDRTWVGRLLSGSSNTSRASSGHGRGVKRGSFGF
ncbi:hypothetical protein F4775DRAFT_542616 [Biscogniauxia sp. FL1348]|nr:hypothetical protein F4775DRAFT_542616 [Biscogniauxia sp. FL1348]